MNKASFSSRTEASNNPAEPANTNASRQRTSPPAKIPNQQPTHPAVAHPHAVTDCHHYPSQPMITIYHNPRCSKSRATYELITTTYNGANEATEIVEYLKHPLNVEQLKQLNAQLGCAVRDMIRDTEAEYKELHLSDASLTDTQLYEALANHPILLQRPIVVRNGRAVIGRPPENVAALFA
jgi:arsenate reductase